MTAEQLKKVEVNFIIGHGRSGTTLFMLALNNTAGCIATPEIKHLLYFYKRYSTVTEVTEGLLSDLREYFSLLQRSRRNPLYSTSDQYFFEKWLQPGRAITYAELCKIIYLSFTEGKSADSISVVLDKNPYYTFHTGTILKVFPDAKFIVMVRHYHAYVLSNLQSQKPFDAIRSVFYYAEAWCQHIRRIHRLIQSYPDRVHIVKYEELVTDKEKTIRRAIEFLGLQYHSSIFDFHAALSERAKHIPEGKHMERTLKKINDLSKPINPDRAYSWRSDLTEEQKRRIEYICADLGKTLDYHPVTVKSSRPYYFFASFTGRLRVKIFFLLGSVRIHHYLNVVRKARYNVNAGTAK